MKPYTKLYLKYFNYCIEDFIPCEICNAKSVDVHHLENRKMGGNPSGDKDVIENLMAVCKKCHIIYGDVPNKKDWLKQIHLKFMQKHKKNG